MGLHHSLPEEEVHDAFNSAPTMFENWGATQLQNLHTMYLSTNADFAVTSRDMGALIKDAIPEGDVAVHRIIKTFSPNSEEITAPVVAKPSVPTKGGSSVSVRRQSRKELTT